MPWWCPGSFWAQTIIRQHNYKATETHPFKMSLTSFDTKKKQNKMCLKKYNYYKWAQICCKHFYDGQITGHITVGNSSIQMAIQFFATTSRGISPMLYNPCTRKKIHNISNTISNRSQPIETTIAWGNFGCYGNFGHHFVLLQFVLVLRYMVLRYMLVDTLWPSDAIWWQEKDT